jgi:hypothetical protein
MRKTTGEAMKWIIGLALVILSPIIIAPVILFYLVWKLPLFAYELAYELYSSRTKKKHNGIGWYK